MGGGPGADPVEVAGFFARPSYRRLSHLVSAYLVGLPLWLLIHLLYRVEIRGRDVIGALTPPLLLVSNHQSLIDSYFVCVLLGLIPRGLLEEWIIPYHTPEETNFMAGPVGRAVHTALRCIPFRRGAGLFQQGMERVIALLRLGRSVVYMFPEGTRSRSGELGRATPGVGRVAVQTGSQVLPVRIWGMDRVLPVGARLPRVGETIRIRVGQVIPGEELQGFADDPRGWKAAADRIMDEIRGLEW